MFRRAIGAMFRKPHQVGKIVFRYRHPRPRLFHTFFCPPLRIQAFEASGRKVFDRVVPPGQIVKLPPCVLVIETSAQEVIDASYRSVSGITLD